MPFIRIRGDNGFDVCGTCEFRESDTCMFCDEGDQYEEADGEEYFGLVAEELMAA